MSTRVIFGKAVRQISNCGGPANHEKLHHPRGLHLLDNSLKQIRSGHHIYWRGWIMVASDYKFEELTSCSHPDFEEFYRIYANSIAARERKSRTWICEMVGRSDYKVLLLKHSNQVTGFSVLFLPQTENFGVLEYMAIADAYRNQGLGAELFRRAMQATRPAQRGQPGPILLEVDSDREKSPDQGLRTRRQQFYRRLGCAMISGLHYIMPLPGVGPPPEMDLFIYGEDRRQVSKAKLEKWLKIIYQGIYNCPPEDPRIGKMLAGVSDPILLT